MGRGSGILYPLRDSNSQKLEPKSSTFTNFAKGVFWGRCEIRTHGTVTSSGFQDRCNRPTLPTFQSSPPEITMSSHIGFLFLKNLLGIPVKNIQHYWEEVCRSPLFPWSPTRAVDILRNHSLGLDSKTVEYLLLIVVKTGLEPVFTLYLY